MAAVGYDSMVWIMGHNLLDDGANQCIALIGLEKGWVAWESGHDSPGHRAERKRPRS